MKFKNPFLLIFFMMFVQAFAAPVSVTTQLKPASLLQGSSGILQVKVTIDPQYHISGAETGMFELSFSEVSGVTFQDPKYPAGTPSEYGTHYNGTVIVDVPVSVSATLTHGEYAVQYELLVQPCSENNEVCYPPETVSGTARFSVIAGSVGIDGGGGIAGRVSNALESGSIVAFFLVFLGGLLTSLTPCVYPMIPITIAVIGAQATGGKLKGFVLSLFYVLGMALTFAILGMVAAKTGGLFGTAVQHPVVNAVIALIFFVMGLSLLGVWVLQMPPSVAARLRSGKRKGFTGALVTGALAGLVVSPCISPLLVVILTWVAKSGSMVLGFGLLFSFALGLGVLFILIGTFSGIIKNLPKSGGWMELIERGFGVMLVILAIVFLKPVLPASIIRTLWSILLVMTGTFTGAFYPVQPESTRKEKIGKSLGLLAVVAGSVLLIMALLSQTGYSISSVTPTVQVKEETHSIWLDSEEAAFSKAAKDGKLVLLDFYANWCAACHELDEKTWPHADVKVALSGYVSAKIDLTVNNDRAKAFQARYAILGMPTVILFTSDGEELARFEGYQSPEFVADLLSQTANNTSPTLQGIR